jgi:hypothetical protein
LDQQSHSESEAKEGDDHETEAANVPEEADDSRESLRRKKKKKKKKKPEFKSWSHHRSSEDNLKVLYLFHIHLFIIFVYCIPTNHSK